MRLPVSILLLSIALPGQEEPAQQGTKSAPDQGSLNGAALTAPRDLFRGTLDLKYMGRWQGGENDNDLFGYGNFDVGDAKTDSFTAHASGRLDWDMDRDRDPTNPFYGVDDTYGSDVTARLYSGYVDWNASAGEEKSGFFKRVRLGRQIFYDTPDTLFLDGISFETMPATGYGDLILNAYVGVPNYFFESSSHGDYTVGAAINFSPWKAARLRFDYVHVTDEYLSTTKRDDLLGFRFDQRLTDNLFVSANFNLIEFDSARDFGTYLAWNDPDNDLTLTFRYSALFSDQRRHSIDFDYFTEIEGTYFAYDEYDFSLYKGLGEHLYFEGGFQWREMRHDSNEGLFNHEFQRYRATPGISEWPWQGSDISITFELWDADGDRITEIGGDFTQEIGERWTCSAGTFFELFRYDAIRGVEDEDVTVSYGRLTYQYSEDLRLRGSFEYEDGETDDYSTLILSAQISF